MTNAQIINNELSEAESGLRIDNPYITVHYFDKPKPVAGGEMYFGLPGQDPELPEKQKRVYYVQEDGSVLSISQPVKLSNGGVASYNGTPAKLAVDGEFSWKVLDKNGQQVYYSPKTTHPNLQDLGSTSIITESIEMEGGESTVTFETIDVSMAVIDVNGTEVESRILLKNVDYTVADGANGTIFLVSSFPPGSVLTARQNAFSSQIDGGSSSYPYVYDTIEEAKQADLTVGDKVIICGDEVYDDGLSFPLCRVVEGGTGVVDNINYLSMDNGLQLRSLEGRLKNQTVSEQVGRAIISSGVLNIDVSLGNVQTVTLTESVSSITFANVPLNFSTSIQLRINQDGSGGRNVNFAGIRTQDGDNISLSTDPSAQNVVVFSTWSGLTWYAFLAGTNMRVVA